MSRRGPLERVTIHLPAHVYVQNKCWVSLVVPVMVFFLVSISCSQLSTPDASEHVQLYQDSDTGPSTIIHLSSYSVNKYLLSTCYVTSISSKVKPLICHLFACLSVFPSVRLSVCANVHIVLGSDSYH